MSIWACEIQQDVVKPRILGLADTNGPESERRIRNLWRGVYVCLTASVAVSLPSFVDFFSKDIEPIANTSTLIGMGLIAGAISCLVVHGITWTDNRILQARAVRARKKYDMECQQALDERAGEAYTSLTGIIELLEN